jgi:hypothetical protein
MTIGEMLGPYQLVAKLGAGGARTVVFPDVRFEEADNHANDDRHPDGARFVMPALEVQSGLLAVFDWAASLSAERNR